MPYTRKQIARINNVDGEPFLAGSHSLALRTSESYIRRRLFALEDATINTLYRKWKAAYSDVKAHALDAANRLNVSTLGVTPEALNWKRDLMEYAGLRYRRLMLDTSETVLERSMLAYALGYYGRAYVLDMATTPEAQIKVPRLENRGVTRRVIQPRLQEAGAKRPIKHVTTDSPHILVHWDDARKRKYPEEWARLESITKEMTWGTDGSTLTPIITRDITETLQEALTPDQFVTDLLGDNWQDTYTDIGDELLIKTRRAIDAGMANGDSLNTLLTGLMAVMGVDAAQKGAFARANSVTRDNMLGAGSSGGVDMFKVNEVWVLGLMWTATANDNRVCPTCRGLHGTIWALGDKNMLIAPFDSHSRCRCQMLPVIIPGSSTPDEEPPRDTWDEWLDGMGELWWLRDELGRAELDSTLIGA